MTQKISAVLIVKNEEALLARCLESVKDADEIIVCDTGSTDGTIEIAKRYTDKVYTDFVWCDDFAAARNHAKSKATGDWILSIDADEYCHDFNEVRRVVELGEKAIRVTMCAENNPLEFTFARLFRNIPEIKWVEPVHNHLNISGEGERIGDVRITFGWSPAHQGDPDRALRILEKAAAADPTSPRRQYYLGREYWYKQQYEKCVVTLGKHVQMERWEAQRADSFLIMSMAFSKLGRDDDARDACAQAIIINSNFKEAIEWMANISIDRNATQWRKMAETANNDDVLTVRSPANPIP